MSYKNGKTKHIPEGHIQNSFFIYFMLNVLIIIMKYNIGREYAYILISIHTYTRNIIDIRQHDY